MIATRSKIHQVSALTSFADWSLKRLRLGIQQTYDFLAQEVPSVA
jgi:hypothetical protein